MPSKNDITGDELKSKPVNDNYRDNFDGIFKKKTGKVEADEVSTERSGARTIEKRS